MIANSPNPALVDSVVDATIKTLSNLYARWLDEHEYENIEDYAIPIKKCLANIKGVEVISMTKRPFGFKWVGPDNFIRHTQVKKGQIVTIRIGMKE